MGCLLNMAWRVLKDAFFTSSFHLSVLKSNARATWFEIAIEFGCAFGRSGNPGDEFQQRLQGSKRSTENSQANLSGRTIKYRLVTLVITSVLKIYTYYMVAVRSRLTACAVAVDGIRETSMA
jgi:hypothetical protein